MDVFVVVFAVIFVVGFVLRGAWRWAMTTRCPYCRTQVDRSATVCHQCGRDLVV